MEKTTKGSSLQLVSPASEPLGGGLNKEHIRPQPNWRAEECEAMCKGAGKTESFGDFTDPAAPLPRGDALLPPRMERVSGSGVLSDVTSRAQISFMTPPRSLRGPSAHLRRYSEVARPESLHRMLNHPNASK